MQLQGIENKIYQIRSQQVMPDFDLAELYGVQTKVLNQAVKRNLSRFPPDFMFQLSREEYNALRSQIVTLENGRGKHSKNESGSDSGVKIHKNSQCHAITVYRK